MVEVVLDAGTQTAWPLCHPGQPVVTARLHKTASRTVGRGGACRGLLWHAALVAAKPTPRAVTVTVEWLVAAAVGALVLLASDWLVPPAQAPFGGHGQRFAEMAAHPFAFGADAAAGGAVAPFPHRILWPLLAHIAGWFGITPVGFTQVCSGALLAVVFWFCRGRRAAWLDALLVTAAVAGSGAVLVYKAMACYSDTLNLLLLLLAVHHVRRAWPFWALVLLGALSHELTLFFAPWLLWLRVQNGGAWRRDVLALAAVVGIYGGWRLLVNALGGGAYSASYYFQNAFWVPWLLPALWFLLALVVLAEFGPLLLLLAMDQRRGAAGMGGRIGAWLYLACIPPLCVFAYDVMRFATLLGLPLVLASVDLLRSMRARIVFTAVLAAQLAVYAWDHPVPGQQGGATFTRVAGDMFARVLLPGRVQDRQSMAFADAVAVSRESWELHWPTALGVVGLFGAIAALAWLLARYVGTASEAGNAPRTRQNASP